MPAVVGPLLCDIDRYEGYRTDFDSPGGDAGSYVGWDGDRRCEYVANGVFDEVMSSTINCRLFSIPGISCPDGCSRVFLR